MNRFAGFHDPESNWSKLPHELIEALPLIDSLGEAKVILYIIRHTWGYGDDEKRITMDEFISGRKRRNGERIDRGTGLSAPTIREGLARAVAHGFIVISTDASDLARIKHYYSLRPFGGERSLPPVSESGGKNLSPTPQESLPPEKEPFQPEKDSLQRSEKETIRKIPPKETEEIVPLSEKEKSAGQIWHAALGELQLQMTKATFDSWVKPTRALSYQNGDSPPRLIVEVRNKYAKQWFDNRLRGMIERTVAHIVDKSVEIEFVLRNESPPAK